MNNKQIAQALRAIDVILLSIKDRAAVLNAAEALEIGEAHSVGDERAAFEAWAKQEYKLPPHGLTRLSSGEYKYSGVSDAWAGWCAALSTAANKGDGHE